MRPVAADGDAVAERLARLVLELVLVELPRELVALLELDGDSPVLGHRQYIGGGPPTTSGISGFQAGDRRVARERELGQLLAGRDERRDRRLRRLVALLVDLEHLLLDRVRPRRDARLEAHVDRALDVPGVGRHPHRRAAGLPRVLLVAVEVARPQLGAEADGALGVLDENLDHRLPGDLALQHDALGGEVGSAALVQLVRGARELRVGAPELVEERAGGASSSSPRIGERSGLSVDANSRHDGFLAYALSSPRRLASSSIFPWAVESCSAQRR